MLAVHTVLKPLAIKRFMSLLVRLPILFALLLIGDLPLSHAQTIDQLKAGVVKIRAKTGQVGTGFLVRMEQEKVFIITAAHVIAGDSQPEVEFFSKRNVLVKGAVLPGAEVHDDVQGLALVLVQGQEFLSTGIQSLAFGLATDLVSGGEEALIIGHPAAGGDWTVVKRDIANRVGRKITLDPGMAARFSGGPILVQNKVMGIVMTDRGGFGAGSTHKSVLNYMEGFGVVPSTVAIVDADQPASTAKSVVPPVHVTPPTKPPRQSLSQTKIGKDGAPMVLVPAGPFTMGSNEGAWVEGPAHRVDLDAYYIDQYEVTVERYQGFLTQTHRAIPEYWEQVDLRRDAQKPVVGIDWDDAQDYCEWAGKRLPTEAEWEKAARGTDARTYPWGEAEPNFSMANFGRDAFADRLYAEKLKAVGSYERGKSPYGAYDMPGNVWEWVADWYAEDYYRNSPQKNPQGPLNGMDKVLRGGSWDDIPASLQSTYRYRTDPTWRSPSDGVRCAQDAP